MAQELLKSFKEFDRIEEQYLSQVLQAMKKSKVSKRWQLKEVRRHSKIATAKPKRNLRHL